MTAKESCHPPTHLLSTVTVTWIRYEGTRRVSGKPESGFDRPPDSEMCDRWAVLTSIFDPTKTVRQLALAEGWCIVVVGDKGGESCWGSRA